MREAVPSLPQYVLMAWCLVKHRVKFTCYLELIPSRPAPSHPRKKCVCSMSELVQMQSVQKVPGSNPSRGTVRRG
jgi:hypothetical protein